MAVPWLQVFRLQAEDGAAMYTTWQGDISAPTNNTEVVEISGLYAAKQGIMDGSEIVVTRVDNIPVCERLFVEPLSVDDWEILELHAAYLEQHLLDQVRVAWKGQIMPLWVNTKICIFVLIESVEPARDCCLLEQMTELHISPKDRHRTVVLPQQPDTAKPKSTKDSSWSQQRPPSKHRTAKLGHTSAQSAEKPCKANSIPIPDVNEDMFHRLLGYFHSLLFGVKPTADTGDDASPDELPYMYSYQREILPIDAVATSSFRIQPCIELDAFATTNDDAVIVKDVPSIVEIPPVLIGHQPTCVYLKMMSYCDTLRHRGYNINVATMPRTFLASIRTSRAPGEREEAMTKNMLNRKPQGIDPSKPSADSLPDEPEAGVHNIVRVVLLDSDNTYTHIGPSGLAIAQVKLGSSKGPLPGHMVVGDLLRRQMSLQVTGRLCVRPLVEDRGTTVAPAGVTGITLHPLFSLPAGFTQEMIVLAFKAWIREITCLDCPLVLSKGTLVKFFLKQDLYGEFLVLLDQTTPLVSPDQTLYCLLQSGLCEDLTIKVAQRMTPANKPPTIHLPCWELAHIDPKLPTVSRQQLGGVNKVFDELKTYLQVSLAVSPLNAHLMSQHRGQRLGTVLLTGPKGSGKSTLARAVCRMLGELPTLAHLTTIDCKPLRGKRVDAIQKQLNKVFSEAAWRQPAVILLDDLDHVTAAPTGPEQEMSGEAVYFARIAEVVKDLCYREVMENSTVVVMATCRSQDSLHPSLTSSRGHHFCQKVVHINPPDKDQRQEMLEALLTFKSEVKKDSVHNLDLAMVARQTEGHVVRDLEQVVDRAVHAHRMVTHDRVGRLGELTDADMEAALGGFTPMGLRHVALHNNGDITWDDVGGLHDVRRSLIETLQWPSKYPQLFANCPLRLRAGLLLYGAPGTGKTLLAAAVAKECGLNFISIKGPELLNKYIGASEQAVRDTFERAQSAKPCVLFFDEFDSLAPRRGHDSTGVTDRVVNQLLTQLDGVEGLEGVYVLAATSRPDLIDPALLRPGRLDKALHCTLPTEQDRVEILTALCRQIELGDDVDVHQVAAACDHFTGADLKALLYNAQLAAIHETTDLWGHVLGETVPTSKTTSEMHSSEGKTQAFPRRNTTFEYVVPENGHQHVKRERVNSSGDSSGSDVSSGGSGQSASWEVVPEGAINERMRTAVAEKPRKNGVVMGGRQMEKPVALGAGEPAALEERTVSQRVEGRRLVAYLPRLEEGIVSVTQRQEDELLSQYRGTAEKTVDKTRGKSVVSCITQSHLVEAACNMQPSVSESERNRFTQIYEQFVEGKGGGSLTEAGKRATLA